MKRYQFLTLATLVLTNFEALAVSDAFRERGASCTDYCTEGGKSVTSDLELMAIPKADIVTNSKTLENKIKFINNHCKILSEREKKMQTYGINHHWCSANCMEKGGLLSKLKGRQEKVRAFIKSREDFCKKTSENYAKLFHEYIIYDPNTKSLAIKKTMIEK